MRTILEKGLKSYKEKNITINCDIKLTSYLLVYTDKEYNLVFSEHITIVGWAGDRSSSYMSHHSIKEGISTLHSLCRSVKKYETNWF